jgi:hypothetical protein
MAIRLPGFIKDYIINGFAVFLRQQFDLWGRFFVNLIFLRET